MTPTPTQPTRPSTTPQASAQSTTRVPTSRTRPIDEDALRGAVSRVLTRWPSAGLAVAVVRGGRIAWFHGHGVEDVVSGIPVTQDTVFRVGSLAKTFTAIAAMQLVEAGRVDLDAPVNDYLTTFHLTTRPGIHPATVRHLLTHTGGVGYWRRLSDLLRPALGAGDAADTVPSPADYYRAGLPQEIEPGTKWTYSNHGFAALGQVVEDVTGQPFAGYLREHVLGPLGMEHTDLVLSERVRPRLASGYVLRPRGLVPVAHRDVPTPASGGLYSTAADLASYLAVLLDNGRSTAGPLVRPATLATMFEPHYQPDPRIPGAGLGFDLGEEGGRPVVGKSGVVSGFLAHLVMAPSDDLGVVVLANTGGLSGAGAPLGVATAVLRLLLGLPESPLRSDLPPRPEVWRELCGWYSPARGPVTNLFTRALMGAGVEVVVDDNHLVLKPLTPLPAMRRGMLLHPDDPDDPYAYRVDLSQLGQGTLPVVFTGSDDPSGPRLLLDLMDFHKRPDDRNPRRLATQALAVGAAGLAGFTLHALRRNRP